jgi:hypothetical protein
MGLLLSNEDIKEQKQNGERRRLIHEAWQRIIDILSKCLITGTSMSSIRVLSDSRKPSRTTYINTKAQKHIQQKRPKQREIRYNTQHRQLYGSTKQCVKRVTK